MTDDTMRLFRDSVQRCVVTSLLITSLATLAGCKPLQDEDRIESLQTQDPILTDATRWVRDVIPTLLPDSHDTPVDFHVLEYDSIQTVAGEDVFYTDGCKVLTRVLPRPTIVCNAHLFYEIEAVIRSFEHENNYFASDEHLFGLVQTVSNTPKKYLMSLRATPGNSSSTEEITQHIVSHMRLVMLYFVNHELGHIRQGYDDRQFISMFSQNQPLETRVVQAVVRMCKHAEEFDNYNFGLPGLEFYTDRAGDVRAIETTMRETTRIASSNADSWYLDEVIADSVAADMTVEYLSRLDRTNPTSVKEEQYIINANLFFVAVYYWYKDLYNFGRLACPLGIENSNSLIVCMMQDQKRYIQVASLFGDIHRFVLLRSYLAMGKILEARTDFFSLDWGNKTIWINQQELRLMSDQEARERLWLAGALQRYYLLAIMMDTAVKFTYLGCGSGWHQVIAKRRGAPQMFVMNFEPIDMVMNRLLEFP